MTLPKYSELNSFNNVNDIENEIFKLQKKLFDLRIQRAANKAILPHLFIHTKRKISQFQYKKLLLIKLQNQK
jgi:ribosomal protein L29